jgi:hypothetical protein
MIPATEAIEVAAVAVSAIMVTGQTAGITQPLWEVKLSTWLSFMMAHEILFSFQMVIVASLVRDRITSLRIGTQIMSTVS